MPARVTRAPHIETLERAPAFGARVAIEAALREPSVTRVLALGLAVRMSDPAAAISRLGVPLAVVQAARDEYGSPDEVQALLESAPARTRLFVVPGTSHLFTEDLDALERTVEEAARWLG